MKKYRFIKGVTLIELVISLSILSIVTIVAVDLFNHSINAYKNDDIAWQIQQDARKALTIVCEEVRGNRITDINGNNIPIWNSSVLHLTDENHRLETIQRGDTYSRNMDTLYLKKGSTLEPIANNINSIYFDYDGNVLSLKLTSQKPGNSNIYSISTKVYSRLTQ